MSLSSLYSSIRPSLLLDFANTGSLDPRITFSRASTATYYDGVTTAKAEQNLFTYSQQFDNAAWAKNNVTVTANTTAAPDGTSTADSMLETAATGIHNISNTTPITVSNVSYTYSIYVKGIGRTYAAINVYDGSSNVTWFDLSTVSVGTNATGNIASIVDAGNGWCRIVVTRTMTAGSLYINTYSSDANNSVSFLGDVTKGLYLWGAQLEQRSSVTAYTATTTQPITNYIPVLQTAAANVARFDHNPTTGEALGLLIEEQRTNLFTYSADFSNAAWTKSNASITANTIVAPDGALDGDKIVENTATGQHRVYKTVSGTTNTNAYTLTVFAKAAERVRIYVGMAESPTFSRQGNAVFDLSAGTVANTTTGLNGATGGVATITNVGNGWYRCAYTLTLGGTDTSIFADINIVSTGTTISYTGDGYSGIFIWGAQLEAGAFPTSAIATTSAQVTRSADAASMTGTNFSSWFNNGQGTLYAEASIPAFSSSSVLQTTQFAVFTGGGSNMMRVRGYSSGTGAYNWDATGTVNAVSQFDTAERVYSTLNSVVKNALAYKVDDIGNSVNGQTVSTDGSAQIPVCNAASIGSSAIGADFSIQHIRKVAYYPQRLSDTNLVALTS